MGLFSRRKPKADDHTDDDGLELDESLFAPIRRLWNISGNHGFTSDQMARLIAIWGDIPSLLIQYYRQLGVQKELNGIGSGFAHLVLPPDPKHQSVWLPPVAPPNDYLEFYYEEQGIYTWGIRSADLTLDDPPVYVTEGYPEDNPVWYLESPNLSDFLLTMAHFQAIGQLPFSSPSHYSISADEEKRVKAKFRVLCRPFEHAWGAVFYGNHDDDSIMIMHDSNNLENEEEIELAYSSGAKGHYDEMLAVLDGMGEPI